MLNGVLWLIKQIHDFNFRMIYSNLLIFPAVFHNKSYSIFVHIFVWR